MSLASLGSSLTLKLLLTIAALVAAGALTTACSRGSLARSVYCGADAKDDPSRGFAEREIDVDGVSLHLHESGSGDPPIVLVHGFGGTSFSWRHLAPSLSRRHRTVAFDLPGHGYSDRPEGFDYSPVRLGKLLLALMERERIEGAVVIGNSYGGAIAVSAVLHAMEADGSGQKRISKMVLVDAAGYPQPIPWHVKLLRVPVLKHVMPALIPPRIMMRFVVSAMYGKNGKPEKAQIREYANAFAVPGTKRTYREFASIMRPEDFEEYVKLYRSIEVPTLVVTGDRDKVVPPSVAERFHEDIKGSRLVVVKGAGHIPQEECPATLLAPLGEFLGEDLTASR